MSERMKIIGVIVAILGLLAITLVAFQLISYRPFEREFFGRDGFPEPPPWGELSPYFLIMKAVLSTVNTILLIIVLVIYLEIYRKTKSTFSLGLVIFTIALLLYSLTSNPLIHGFAGFRLSGLGPFTILPDLFTCIASAILLYLSRQ